jgi:putative oxidoreductase
MAVLAGSAEFGGGLATALGIGGPLGPTTIASTMAVAAATTGRGKPYFGQSGGPEMSILYGAIGIYFAFDGLGNASVDRVFHTKVPRTLALAYAAATALAARAIVMRAWQAQDAARAANEHEQPWSPLTAVTNEPRAS